MLDSGGAAAARQELALRNLHGLLQENHASMRLLQSSHLLDALPANAPAVEVPMVMSQAGEQERTRLQVENDELRLGIQQLRSDIDAAHARASTIAELHRKETDIHTTLLRAAFDEAIASRNDTSKEVECLRAHVARISSELHECRRQLSVHRSIVDAEVSIFWAERSGPGKELISSYPFSSVGVHLAILRNELASMEKSSAAAMAAPSGVNELRPGQSIYGTHSRRESLIVNRATCQENHGASRSSIVGGVQPTSDSKHLQLWSQQQEHVAVSDKALILSRLDRLEQTADAASTRYEALLREHDALKRRHAQLQQKVRREAYRMPLPMHPPV